MRPIFSGKGEFSAVVWGKISRAEPEKGVFFVIANGNKLEYQIHVGDIYYSQNRGVPVMWNEERYPVVLWEEGGAGRKYTFPLFLPEKKCA